MARTEHIRSFLAAVGEGDVDAMARHWTEDYVLELPYADPPLVFEGKQAAREYLKGALGVFSMQLQVTDLYECPDQDAVIAEYVSEGKATTTNKPYANRYIGIFIFSGEKVCRQREFFNPLPAAAALS